MSCKRIFTIILLGACFAKGFAQTKMLYVKEKSKAETTIPLTQIQSLTFVSGQLSLSKTDGSKVSYPLSTLRYLSFTEYKDTDTGTDTDPGTGTPTNVLNQTVSVAPSLFPNPVKNVLFIQHSSLENVEIISSIGQIVYSSTQVSESGIDVSSLTAGVYLCRMQQGNTQIIKRFIKE